MEAYGYLRYLHGLFGHMTDATWRPDEDEPNDPSDDPPWSVLNRIELKRAGW